MDVREAFGDFGGRSWLNTAHQGALPRCAANAAAEAVSWKTHPFELAGDRFAAVPARLRSTLGRLVGAPADEIVLANGASYGLHLIANGMSLVAGDEVLLVRGDFPSNLLPWLGLRRRGVLIRWLEPRRFVVGAQEVAETIGPRTRVLCASWVHSFSGFVTDLDAVGAACRDRGVRFVVNATQGLGARPLDVQSLPVDAVISAGWKWLCGPYGTGFCWLRPELAVELDPNLDYWLSRFSADDLGQDELDLEGERRGESLRFDLFATANFFQFVPWTAALEWLLDLGIDNVARHDQDLVSRLLAGLDRSRYRVLSPEAEPERSTLAFLSAHDPERNPEMHRKLRDAGVDVALRRGALRVSPHIHNVEADIDRLLAALQK